MNNRIDPCMQCGGSGLYQAIGRSSWECGFCMGTGKVAMGSQWLLSPYHAKRPSVSEWGDWLGWVVLGSFLFGLIGLFVVFCDSFVGGN